MCAGGSKPAAAKEVTPHEDRQAISALPKNERFVDPAFAPAWDRPEG